MRIATKTCWMFFLLTLFVHAHASEEQNRDDAKVSQYATELFANGRLDEARELVRKLRQKPTPPKQAIFLSGVLYYHEGNYSAAAEEFRVLLAMDPSLLRPRLELARALYMMGEYRAAQYHFEQVLAAALPVEVRWNVENFVRDIQENRMTVSFGLDVITDSNPSQATSAKTVDIGGYTYILNEDARAKHSSGVALTADVKIPMAISHGFFVRSHIEHSAFSEHTMDWTYFQLMAGKHMRLPVHTLTAEGGGHLAHYGNSPLYHGLVLGVADSFHASPNVAIKVSTEAREMTYDKYRFLEGWNYGLALDALYASTTKSRWEMRLALTKGTARDRAYAYMSPALSGRYAKEWNNGLATGLRLQLATVNYERNDPLFNVVRHDNEWSVELDAIKRIASWQGLAPRFVCGYIHHESNLPLYAFERGYYRIGVTKQF